MVVTKKLMQMHNMTMFTPIFKDSLISESKKKAVQSLMYLKEKWEKSTKAHFVLMARGNLETGPSRKLCP